MKNLITITLLIACISIYAQKTKLDNSNIVLKEKSQTKVQQENLPHFIQFGIMSRNHESFKSKYGIAVIYQNCVISQFLSQKAKENNKLIAKTLTEKYGDTWRKDLGFIPYGL